ncbi:uncharacterized protein LOC120344702 isoform X2 [Styela clava]
MKENLLIFVGIFAWMVAVVSAGRGKWNAFGSYQYYVSGKDDKKSYVDGETFCKNNDGEIAMIKTSEIQMFIQNQVSATSGQPYGFYIGLKEVGTNDTFIWNDNSELTYTNWNSGEPSSDKPEPCVAMGWWHTYYANLPWYDVNCTANSPTAFVCQRVIGWNWGSWESWGSCECPGMRQRNRTCVDSGRIGPYSCNDTASQFEICTPSASCNATMPLVTTAPTPQGKYWGTWSSWSECNCSTIIKLRNRTCINSPRTRLDACAGSRNETANCTKDPACYTTTVAETTFQLTTTAGELTTSSTNEEPTDVMTTMTTGVYVVANATFNLHGTSSSFAEVPEISTIGILRPSTPAAQTSIIGPVVGIIGGFLLLALIIVFILSKQLKKRGRGIINTGDRCNYNEGLEMENQLNPRDIMSDHPEDVELGRDHSQNTETLRYQTFVNPDGQADNNSHLPEDQVDSSNGQDSLHAIADNHQNQINDVTPEGNDNAIYTAVNKTKSKKLFKSSKDLDAADVSETQYAFVDKQKKSEIINVSCYPDENTPEVYATVQKHNVVDSEKMSQPENTFDGKLVPGPTYATVQKTKSKDPVKQETSSDGDDNKVTLAVVQKPKKDDSSNFNEVTYATVNKSETDQNSDVTGDAEGADIEVNDDPYANIDNIE